MSIARFSSLLVAVALFGCEKPNDIATLHDEAIAISTYYQPAIDGLAKRGQAIVERGGKLGAAMPGGEIASRQISLAGQQLAELRNLVTPGADGKSALAKQADAAAKDGKRDELMTLIGESSEKLEVGVRVITGELNVAENWLLQAEAAKGQAIPAPAAPAPTDTPDTAPVTGTAPEAASGSGTAPAHP